MLPQINRILRKIPIKPADFRSVRISVNQVLFLTTYIGAGFQRFKTSTVFIDVSAAYDIAWRQRLVHKLIQAACINTATVINNVLINSTFHIVIREIR